jgi:hypothetical protein
MDHYNGYELWHLPNIICWIEYKHWCADTFCNFSQEALTTNKGTNQHTTASISKRVISLKEGNGNLKKSGDSLPWLHI